MATLDSFDRRIFRWVSDICQETRDLQTLEQELQRVRAEHGELPWASRDGVMTQLFQKICRDNWNIPRLWKGEKLFQCVVVLHRYDAPASSSREGLGQCRTSWDHSGYLYATITLLFRKTVSREVLDNVLQSAADHADELLDSTLGPSLQGWITTERMRDKDAVQGPNVVLYVTTRARDGQLLAFLFCKSFQHQNILCAPGGKFTTFEEEDTPHTFALAKKLVENSEVPAEQIGEVAAGMRHFLSNFGRPTSTFRMANALTERCTLRCIERNLDKKLASYHLHLEELLDLSSYKTKYQLVPVREYGERDLFFHCGRERSPFVSLGNHDQRILRSLHAQNRFVAPPSVSIAPPQINLYEIQEKIFCAPPMAYPGMKIFHVLTRRTQNPLADLQSTQRNIPRPAEPMLLVQFEDDHQGPMQMPELLRDAPKEFWERLSQSLYWPKQFCAGGSGAWFSKEVQHAPNAYGLGVHVLGWPTDAVSCAIPHFETSFAIQHNLSGEALRQKINPLNRDSFDSSLSEEYRQYLSDKLKPICGAKAHLHIDAYYSKIVTMYLRSSFHIADMSKKELLLEVLALWLIFQRGESLLDGEGNLQHGALAAQLRKRQPFLVRASSLEMRGAFPEAIEQRLCHRMVTVEGIDLVSYPPLPKYLSEALIRRSEQFSTIHALWDEYRETSSQKFQIDSNLRYRNGWGGMYNFPILGVEGNAKRYTPEIWAPQTRGDSKIKRRYEEYYQTSFRRFSKEIRDPRHPWAYPKVDPIQFSTPEGCLMRFLGSHHNHHTSSNLILQLPWAEQLVFFTKHLAVDTSASSGQVDSGEVGCIWSHMYGSYLLPDGTYSTVAQRSEVEQQSIRWLFHAQFAPKGFAQLIQAQLWHQGNQFRIPWDIIQLRDIALHHPIHFVQPLEMMSIEERKTLLGELKKFGKNSRTEQAIQEEFCAYHQRRGPPPRDPLLHLLADLLLPSEQNNPDERRGLLVRPPYQREMRAHASGMTAELDPRENEVVFATRDEAAQQAIRSNPKGPYFRIQIAGTFADIACRI